MRLSRLDLPTLGRPTMATTRRVTASDSRRSGRRAEQGRAARAAVNARRTRAAPGGTSPRRRPNLARPWPAGKAAVAPDPNAGSASLRICSRRGPNPRPRVPPVIRGPPARTRRARRSTELLASHRAARFAHSGRDDLARGQCAPDVAEGDPKVGGHPGGLRLVSRDLLAALHLVVRQPQRLRLQQTPRGARWTTRCTGCWSLFRHPDGRWFDDAESRRVMTRLRDVLASTANRSSSPTTPSSIPTRSTSCRRARSASRRW
jgi:hypothetical protein